MAIISVISVNIIAPLITFFEARFHFSIWLNMLQVIPFIWISVIALVLITHKLAEFLTNKIVDKNDSFNSQIIINTLCTVFLMSIFMTIVGTWIGCRQVSLEPITSFFHKWPRNFAVSFAIELLIAQPIARFAMYKMHQLMDSKQTASEA